ncbi:MAG: asparagine synthase (glutamine-hydrolyzing) [Nitrospiraceae bacterium]
MSGIVGIYNLDGRPVEQSRLQAMTDRLLHRGPDGCSFWRQGAIGLGHLMLRTTPESLDEKQPLVDETGRLCLTFDGRVDNREDLRSALLAAGSRPHSRTDAELVLRAYQCWSEDCARRIIGDFAFALWDGWRRRLFCARDPLGIRPLCYAFHNGNFAFASEVQSVLDGVGLQLRPNRSMLGEYLSNRICSLDETLYAGVFRLPPATALTLQADGRQDTWRYFTMDPNRRLRYHSDDDYAEHFREVFAEAVRCRLRSVTPVSVFLSGGLDSSAIFGMAQELARRGAEPIRWIQSYTLAFSRPAADERPYVRAVDRLWGTTTHILDADCWVAPPLADQVRLVGDFPDLPNTAPWSLLYERAREHGSRVVLWGFGGDEWLTGNPVHCADLLRRLHFRRLFTQMRHDVMVHRLCGDHTGVAVLAARWCLLPIIPRALKSAIKRVTRRDVPRWINPAFARQVDLQARLLRRPAILDFPDLVQGEIAGQLQSGWAATEYDLVNRFEARLGMEGRSPFCDRRMIEYALALPEEQRWRGARPRFIMRRAVRGLVPVEIGLRLTKADFSFLYKEALAGELRGVQPARLRLVEDGYLDAEATSRLLARCATGDRDAMGPGWMILATERWYADLCKASDDTKEAHS